MKNYLNVITSLKKDDDIWVKLRRSNHWSVVKRRHQVCEIERRFRTDCKYVPKHITGRICAEAYITGRIIPRWKAFIWIRDMLKAKLCANLSNPSLSILLFLPQRRRIHFFYLLRIFVLILAVFCVVSSFIRFQLNFTSALLQVIYRDLGLECWVL